MELTSEEKAILAYVVVDPAAWLAHAVEARGEERAAADLSEKIARWKPEYEKAKISLDYKTRVERDSEALNQPTPEQIAAQEKEALIQAKIREMAEAALIAEGKLTAEK